MDLTEVRKTIPQKSKPSVTKAKAPSSRRILAAPAAQRRWFIVEKAVDMVLDNPKVELFDNAEEIGRARRAHRDSQRMLDRPVGVDRR